MDVFFLVLLFMCYATGLSSLETQSNWILVANSSEEHPWWHKGMPMKGEQVTWQLSSNEHHQILKILLLQSLSSKKYCELTTNITLQQQFDPQSYQINTLSTSIHIYQGGRHLNQQINSTVPLSLMIHNGQGTFKGQNFYFWFRLDNRFSVNYTIIFVLAAILIIKTEIIFGIRGRFTGPEYVIPGLLIYFVIFPKGIQRSASDLCFESSWEYGKEVVYSLAVYVWLPYVVRIFTMFYTMPSLRQNRSEWKALIIGVLGTLFSSYGIFWELNEISLLIVFAIELSLTRGVHLQPSKKNSITLKSIYVLDIIVVLYLLIWPIYPSKHLLTTPIWLLGAFFLILCEVITYFARKQVPVKDKQSTSVPKKGAEKRQ